MPYIARFSMNTTATCPFPYDIPAVRIAKGIGLNGPEHFLQELGLEMGLSG